MIEFHEGDNRGSLRRLIEEGVRVHAVVTDPPYSLTSITKRFGKEGSKAARTDRNDGSFARVSGGFMGKAWDATGIERDPEFWRLIYDILLPGGCVFAFAGARTGHWQACAMETAGFIMHPEHGWLYGQGFPKGHDAERAGAGEAWAGWKYGTQTQKPALEPIYLGQRPYSEKTGAANLLKHGVGAFNIDGCRVLSGEETGGERPSYQPNYGNSVFGKGMVGGAWKNTNGRYPANVLHDGSPEVLALFPDSAGQQGDVRGTEPSSPTDEIYGQFKGRVAQSKRADTGSAARFFNSFPLTAEDIAAIPPWFYHGKANSDDREGSSHPTVKPVGLLQHLIRHLCPLGGLLLDPFAGSGTTGAAANKEGINCILMESDPDYARFLRSRFKLSKSDLVSEMYPDLF